jgi:hypothetical protein
MVRLMVVVLVLTACDRDVPLAHLHQRAAQSAPSNACIVRGSWPALDSINIDEHEIDLCAEDVVHEPHQPRACFQVDLDTGRYRPTQTRPRRPAHEPEHVTGAWASIDDAGVHICPPSGPCRTLRPPGVELGQVSEVATNSDGSRFLVCHSGGCDPLDIRDSATGLRIETIPPWKTGMGDPASFQAAYFAGDRILGLVGDTPVSSDGRLFDARGKLLLKLGELAEHEPHALGGDRWAIETWEARELLIVDDHSRLTARYPLRPPIAESIDGSIPLVAAVAARADGGLSVVLAHDVVGVIAVYAANPAVPPRVIEPPKCAP